MPVNNPEELFVWLLSNVRQREERSKKVFQELSDAVEDQDIKERLDSRIFVQDSIISRLDQVFKMIGKQPVKTGEKIADALIEDFRSNLAGDAESEGQGALCRHKANQIMHLHIGEYGILTAMADITGNYGVGTLLETCLADNLAFAERTRRRIRRAIEAKWEERMAEATA